MSEIDYVTLCNIIQLANVLTSLWYNQEREERPLPFAFVIFYVFNNPKRTARGFIYSTDISMLINCNNLQGKLGKIKFYNLYDIFYFSI